MDVNYEWKTKVCPIFYLLCISFLEIYLASHYFPEHDPANKHLKQ